MSDDYKRQHESGTAKREKGKKEEEDQKKMKGSMEGFLSRKATAKTGKLNQSGSSSLSSTQKSQNDTDTPDSTDLQILQQPMDIRSDFTGDADTVDTYPKSPGAVEEDPAYTAYTNIFDSHPSKWHATPELIHYFSGHNPKQNSPSHQHYMSESHHCRSVKDMPQYVISNNFSVAFPNVCIAFRIYLSILGSSCEEERSFSTLIRAKNYTR